MKTVDAAPGVSEFLKIDKDTVRHSPIKHPDIRLNMRPMSMAFTARGNALLDKGRFAA
jgi:Cu/Ag efflux protein CusF